VEIVVGGRKLMPPCKAVLKERKTLCADTMAFYLKKPDDFEFEAGQFFNFTLLESAHTDLKGSTRALSIASAPHEKNLMIAMRMRATAFKQGLSSLPIGTEVLLQGPYGWMTLPKKGDRPVVLLAGGIGITPFRSLVWHAAESLSPRNILLFYSVRIPEEAAFLGELQEMEHYNQRYKLICTVTQPERARTPWNGETGRISLEILSKWIPDLNVPIYYIAGPPGMVTGVRQMLVGAGISEQDIRAEEFAGYE
jgi:ferredoxin-NADP reductase